MASKKTFLVTDAVAALLSVVSLIGIFTVFAPCGPKEDGSWMVCHWAGNAVKGISLVLAVLSLIRLFIADEKIKIGLSLAVFAVTILETAVPGHLISLCMMKTMRCHTLTQPGVTVFSILIALTALADTIWRTKKK